MTKVPLIISAPGIKASRSESIVELVDLMPTLAELCDIEIPKGMGLIGTALTVHRTQIL